MDCVFGKGRPHILLLKGLTNGLSKETEPRGHNVGKLTRSLLLLGGPPRTLLTAPAGEPGQRRSD